MKKQSTTLPAEKPKAKKQKALEALQPYMIESAEASTSSTTTTRRDVAGSIPRTDK